ncbi:ThiS family protein [Acinetobacter junii SH205]|uniref:Molybdopterin synthase sulfur carrier subunit n=3 Tax=Acinetobacter TaxID=469 RepID=D0SR60_ACIJU|nr:ThiS family protein [Acinetobacter junii SH205]
MTNMTTSEMTRTDMTKTDSMTISILYFASLADEAKCHEEKVTVQKSISLHALYANLNQKHCFSKPQSQLRVAVNDYFVDWDQEVCDGDNVVFMTPVAGG